MSNYEHTRVEPNRLANAASNIEGSLGILSGAFKTIDETLRASLQPSWEGTASDNFFTTYELDTQTFASHTKSLKTLNDRLKEASAVYDAAENKASELVTNLKL